jgi:hypothetical protein
MTVIWRLAKQVIAGRQPVVDGLALFAGFCPRRVQTEKAVAQVIGNGGFRRLELNLQISGAGAGDGSVIEGEGPLIESHLFDEGAGMSGSQLAVRGIDGGDVVCAGELKVRVGGLRGRACGE